MPVLLQTNCQVVFQESCLKVCYKLAELDSMHGMGSTFIPLPQTVGRLCCLSEDLQVDLEKKRPIG